MALPSLRALLSRGCAASGGSVLWPSPTSCKASTRLSPEGLYRALSTGLPAEPDRLSPEFAWNTLLRMPSPFTPPVTRVHVPTFFPVPVRLRPSNRGSPTRITAALPAIPATLPFTMLTDVRLPTACAFASPLRLARSPPVVSSAVRPQSNGLSAVKAGECRIDTRPVLASRTGFPSRDFVTPPCIPVARVAAQVRLPA